jgi:hypothetical protein
MIPPIMLGMEMSVKEDWVQVLYVCIYIQTYTVSP